MRIVRAFSVDQALHATPILKQDTNKPTGRNVKLQFSMNKTDNLAASVGEVLILSELYMSIMGIFVPNKKMLE